MEYEHGTGWSDLADQMGFVVVYPEQTSANNPKACFSWFQRNDTARDMGEALSIRQMVEHAAEVFGIDRSRVFVTGLSAGGAMTSVMLATYPETFAGGAIIAGLPYGCATNVQQAFEAMFTDTAMPASELGDRVRAASAHRGSWPRISVWHGAADSVVRPSNAANVLRQWSDVHGLAEAHTDLDWIGGHERRLWTDADGAPVIESISIGGMGHGVPVAPAMATAGCGVSGPFFLDVGLASTQHIARFWGLAGAETVTLLRRSVVRQSEPHQREREADAAFAREKVERLEPVGSAPAYGDPARVIEAALRAAGLSADGAGVIARSARQAVDPATVIAAALKAAGLKR